MPTIFDYIATMDAAPVDNPTGDGFCVIPFFTGTGSGTSGCVGIATLPALAGTGTADWKPIGAADLPAMTGDGMTDGYRPAWGAADLPAFTGDGTAHVLIESMSLLPPIFAVGYAGATAEATLPSMSGYGLDASFSRTASGAGTLPALTATSLVCGLDKPIDNGATSAAVVNLLQLGNTTLADAAASICAYDVTDDERAMSVVYFVSNLMAYVQDGDGIGDHWTCALATWRRGYGDCEDGAILVHSLLLAAGVNPDRLRTAFGAALSASLAAAGHAWCLYRRETDEEWVPLDWTLGATAYVGAISGISRQIDLAGTYTAINHVLTHEAFYAVNDADYIANLAANRSTGSAALPAPSCAAAAGLSASASLVLFAGVLATSMTVSGQAGARAAMALPAAALSGTAQEMTPAVGPCAVPLPVVAGTAGAIGAGALPLATATGTCGLSARADLALPLLALSASGQTAALVAADLLLPRAAVQASAVAGVVVNGGDCDVLSLRATGRAAQGPMARAALALPRAMLAGHASPLSACLGDCDLPPLGMRGHAPRSKGFGILRYDASRWT